MLRKYSWRNTSRVARELVVTNRLTISLSRHILWTGFLLGCFANSMAWQKDKMSGLSLIERRFASSRKSHNFWVSRRCDSATAQIQLCRAQVLRQNIPPLQHLLFLNYVQSSSISLSMVESMVARVPHIKLTESVSLTTGSDLFLTSVYTSEPCFSIFLLCSLWIRCRSKAPKVDAT